MIKLVTNQKKFYNSFDIISVNESLHILESMSQISCDTETSGYDFNTKELLLTQIGNKDVQIVIDNTSISLQHYKGILENKPSIWQNFQFDGRFLYKYDIYPKKIYDTLIAEAILLSGLGDESDIKDVKDAFNKKIADKFISRSLGLDAIVEKYCGVMLNKSIRGEINKIGVTDRVIKYAAGDVKYLEEVQEKQMSKIHEYTKKYNIDGDIIDLEMNATLAITRMCYNGVKLDADKYRKEVINKVIKNLNDSIHKLDSEVLKEPKLKKWHFVQGNLFFQDRRTEINWNSYKQKMEILPLLDPTITSTGAQEIRKRSDKHPIFPVILDYNKAKKLESSFGESLLKHINTKSGRIHPSVWQVLATGRISMSDPNLLQIPGKGELAKTIRSCFILEKGNKFVGGDYSSFELTVIAEFSQDPLWIDTLNAGENLHTVLCSETFDISQDKVNDPFPYNKDMTYRAVQKTIDFGLAYGMSEFKLSNTIGVSEKEAKEVIDKFFSKVPKVKSFLDTLGKLGRKRGYIKVPNPYGRIRFFPKFDVLKAYPGNPIASTWYGEMERAGKNTPIQGLNGNVIKLALIKVQETIDKHNYPAKILLSIYDELQTETTEEFAEEWRNILEAKMIEAGKFFIKTVPVKADCSINDYWTK